MTIQPTIERSLNRGSQRLFFFANGYGASVVQGPYSYDGDQGLFELAVIRLTGDGPGDYKLTYDTPITDDVVGYLTEEDVQSLLVRIRDLSADVIKVTATLGEPLAITSGEKES